MKNLINLLNKKIEKHFVFLLLLLLFISCKSENSIQDLFSDSIVLSTSLNFDLELNGNVEDIYCNDSILITYNSGLDYSFTIYNLNKKGQIRKFGTIGNGKGEIPTGCFGGIYDNNLIVFKDVNKIIAKYKLLSENDNMIADTIISYKIDNTMISSLVTVDSNLYLGMGAYNWEYHYVLFDSKGNIYDKSIPLYNATDNHFNKFTKFLSNQGLLIRHPNDNKYVGITNNSELIDFLSVSDKKISILKTYHETPPLLEVVQMDKMNRVVWTDETINGFLSLAGNDKYVFALFSNERMKEESYQSNTILVFDWNGNPIKQIKLNEDVQLIAVNSSSLFALIEDNEGGQHLKQFKIEI